MSQHKTDATKFVELADKQNYVPDTRGFQVDANDVYEKLVQSDRPLSRSDVQQLAHRSEAEAQRRLNRLVSEGKVEKRHDGPDGRIVYYQPAGMDYEWPNGGDGK